MFFKFNYILFKFYKKIFCLVFNIGKNLYFVVSLLIFKPNIYWYVCRKIPNHTMTKLYFTGNYKKQDHVTK